MPLFNFGYNQNRDTGSWPNISGRNSYSANNGQRNVAQNPQLNSRYQWVHGNTRNGHNAVQQPYRQSWGRYPQQNNAGSMFWSRHNNDPSRFPQQNNNTPSMFPQQNNSAPSMFPQQNNSAPSMFPQQNNSAPSMFPQQNNSAPSMFPQQNNNVPPMSPQQNNSTQHVNAPPVNTAPPETRHLPDGVTMHPLDQNTMNELRRGNMSVLGSLGTQPPVTEVAEQVTPALSATGHDVLNVGGAPMDISDRLRGFIHDERNATLFYKYLSGIAPRRDYRNMLAEISEGCSQRRKVFSDIYNGIRGESFTPADAVVDTSVGFDDGLRWAISVENTALRNLCDLYEATSDTLSSKRLATQMYKKFCDLSSLHLMMR